MPPKSYFHVFVIIGSCLIAAFAAAYRWLIGGMNFRDIGFIVAMLAVLLFMVIMMWNLRSVKSPERYLLEAYNPLGEKDDIGFRKEYKEYDVAHSYMRMYKNMYPHYRFILVSDDQHSDKKMVHKWIE